MLKYPELVKKSRLLYTVSGKIAINPKYTDKELDEQITLLMESKPLNDSEFELLTKYFIENNFPDEDMDNFITGKLNLEFDIINDVWKNFGNIAFHKKYFKDSVSKTALGLFDVFDESKYNKFSEVQKCFYKFKPNVIRHRKLIELKSNLKPHMNNMFGSYSDYFDAIDNAKKVIEDDAVKFYMDPTKPLVDRIKLFNRLGKKNNYMYNPDNKNLNKIFQMSFEDDFLERHTTISCVDVIEEWIEGLKSKRTHIDYSKNEYHPSLETEQRNYNPSQESMDRLFEYYFNNLVIEGVSEFILDW